MFIYLFMFFGGVKTGKSWFRRENDIF